MLPVQFELAGLRFPATAQLERTLSHGVRAHRTSSLQMKVSTEAVAAARLLHADAAAARGRAGAHAAALSRHQAQLAAAARQAALMQGCTPGSTGTTGGCLTNHEHVLRGCHVPLDA